MNVTKLIISLLLLTSAVTHSAGENIVPNPHFASGIQSWSVHGALLAWSPQEGHAGKGCAFVNRRSDIGFGLALDLKGLLTPSAVYTFRAWVKPVGVVPTQANILLYTQDSDGEQWRDVGSQMILPGQWTEIVGCMDAPALRGELKYQLVNIGSGAAVGIDLYVDDVSITRADTVSERVLIDCSKRIGESTARGIGFLMGVSATLPEASLFEALNPKLLRYRPMTNGAAAWGEGTGFVSEPFMKRLASAGVKSQIVLSDEYCWSHGYHNSWGWPGDPAHDGLSSFALLDLSIESVYQKSHESGYAIEWDIWNEPDYYTKECNCFWGRDQGQYLRMWKHAYDKIRSLDPKATIVGPSNANFARNGIQGAFIKAFLLFCKQNNCLPDVLSWHEMDDYRSLPRQIQMVRAFLRTNKIKQIPIDINEYMGKDYTRRPGVYPWFWSTMEAQDIRYGVHSCWSDGEGKPTETAGRLDGITTDAPHQPLAAWHVTKAYSQMVGELLTVQNGVAVGGLACRGKGDMVTVLLGNSSKYPQKAALSFKGLRQQGGAVLVMQRIPDTGWVSVPLPAREQSDVFVKNGQLTLDLAFAPYEAVALRVVTLMK